MQLLAISGKGNVRPVLAAVRPIIPPAARREGPTTLPGADEPATPPSTPFAAVRRPRDFRLRSFDKPLTYFYTTSTNMSSSFSPFQAKKLFAQCSLLMGQRLHSVLRTPGPTLPSGALCDGAITRPVLCVDGPPTGPQREPRQ